MNVRVYYEDTDAAGVVYHANYLNFLERARTEYLRDRGFSIAELAKSGAVFPVIRVELDFKSPACHDDLLSILTRPMRVGGSSFVLHQQIRRDDKLLVDAYVTLACINDFHKPKRVPLEVRKILEQELPGIQP